MIIDGCIYRASGQRAGEILSVVSLDDSWIDDNVGPDEAFFATLAPPSPASDRVDLSGGVPAIVARPVLAGFDTLAIAADGVAVATLSGLPDGAVVSIDGIAHTVGGMFGLRTTMAGTYSVVVDAWPAQLYSAEVVAT